MGRPPDPEGDAMSCNAWSQVHARPPQRAAGSEGGSAWPKGQVGLGEVHAGSPWTEGPGDSQACFPEMSSLDATPRPRTKVGELGGYLNFWISCSLCQHAFLS